LGVAWAYALKDYLFVRRVMIVPKDLAIVFAIVVVVCLLGSALSVRVAVKVDPAKALASG
jgi:putative ABC transport system permease protein